LEEPKNHKGLILDTEQREEELRKRRGLLLEAPS
jgi:hypothetical protein